MDLEGRMSFLVEWYDTAASIARQYQLFFYPEDNSVEMFDIKNRKVFLKRTVCQSVTPADLYVGSTVTVYARQLRVVGCGDQATTRTLTSARESTYAMIKPDAYVHIGKILTMIFKAGFTLNNLKMLKLDRATAESFYGEHVGKPFFERLVSFMTEDAVVAMELAGKDAIPKWRGLLGPTNTAVAKEQAPDSIRGRFGTDGTRNAAHGSDSKASAARVRFLSPVSEDIDISIILSEFYGERLSCFLHSVTRGSFPDSIFFVTLRQNIVLMNRCSLFFLSFLC
eukprot:TRINITY_DN3408_c0_g1_i7.p1 TRINITY_DN3408_c0_g1~~TRINITY_DN3408_c0_g1_i7.p1  ORF type:complete len:282 (+),score=37.57 TRINITY_DN3408_c0_g1_i7:116-961(+)